MRHPYGVRGIAPVVLIAAAIAPSPVIAPARAFAPDPLLPGARVCPGGAGVKASHRRQRLAMHCLINEARRRDGARRLRSSAALRHSATYKARRIAACKRFTHAPCGDDLAVSFHQARVTAGGPWYVGENLGWRPFEEATARAILRGWLRSPAHRQVLLDRRFTHLGVRRRRLRLRGASRGAVLWVAHLGTPKRGEGR
jgi:uncharacterized protein YkwD